MWEVTVMEKIKVGIIGAGRIGQVHAKSITYHIPQAEIVAISDIFVLWYPFSEKNLTDSFIILFLASSL